VKDMYYTIQRQRIKWGKVGVVEWGIWEDVLSKVPSYSQCLMVARTISVHPDDGCDDAPYRIINDRGEIVWMNSMCEKRYLEGK